MSQLSQRRRPPADQVEGEVRALDSLSRVPAHAAGVDIGAHEISVSLAQTIVAEVGTDMTRFPTEKRFCAWLGLAPHNDISGGKVLAQPHAEDT